MQDKKRTGPRINARSLTTREESRRVNTFVAKAGSRPKAAAELGVGLLTLEQAVREGGSMLAKTKTKLLAALERAECA